MFTRKPLEKQAKYSIEQIIKKTFREINHVIPQLQLAKVKKLHIKPINVYILFDNSKAIKFNKEKLELISFLNATAYTVGGVVTFRIIKENRASYSRELY